MASDRHDHACEAIAPDSLADRAGAMWQWPFIGLAAWWNMMMELWFVPPAHHHCDPEQVMPDHQLLVPEPIEDDARPELFA
jgi:hypothetical protein